eukprot:scaffold47845_cov49-Attheya_sp.AAC.4
MKSTTTTTEEQENTADLFLQSFPCDESIEINNVENKKDGLSPQQQQYLGRKPQWWRKLSGRRATKGQRGAIARMIDRGFVVPAVRHGPQMLDWNAIFSRRNNKVTFEIGFGGGENLFEKAQLFPEINLIAAEIHQPGVGALFTRMEQKLQEPSSNERLFDNVKVYMGDGVKLLSHMPSGSISEIYLTFPDPWPNYGHFKWRVLQEETLNELHRVLSEHGTFFLATDATCFDDWSITLFKSHVDAWRPIEPCPDRRTWLPVLSKYEQKGIDEGRQTTLRCWKKI